MRNAFSARFLPNVGYARCAKKRLAKDGETRLTYIYDSDSWSISFAAFPYSREGRPGPFEALVELSGRLRVGKMRQPAS